MTEEEKLSAVPRLREEGNYLYRQKDYEAAANKYAEAIGYLEQLLLRCVMSLLYHLRPCIPIGTTGVVVNLISITICA